MDENVTVNKLSCYYYNAIKYGRMDYVSSLQFTYDQLFTA